tara:strand:+ start:164 stop:379 length:216 start_codon:yes stop_codon:yes gene_type:complete
MNKITIIVGMLTALSCKPEVNEIQTALDHIGDMQEWIIEDVNNGSMDTTVSEYYLHALNKTEKILLNKITN